MHTLTERPEIEVISMDEQSLFGQAQRRLIRAAVLHERRFEIAFDRSSGDYRLGVAASS
jgi:hypothetical protein